MSSQAKAAWQILKEGEEAEPTVLLHQLQVGLESGWYLERLFATEEGVTKQEEELRKVEKKRRW